MKRRGFIRKVFGFAVGLLSVVTISDGLPECPNPPKHPVKSPKPSHWHHFVCNRVGNKCKMYLDGKKIKGMYFGGGFGVIKSFRREQVGCIVQEEYWFDGKYSVIV